MGLYIAFGIYFIIINAIGYFAMGIDKRMAVKHRRRIPESTLFSIAIFFGAPGILMGMRRFNHKTKKLKFSVGIPLIFGLEIIVIALLLLV